MSEYVITDFKENVPVQVTAFVFVIMMFALTCPPWGVLEAWKAVRGRFGGDR